MKGQLSDQLRGVLWRTCGAVYSRQVQGSVPFRTFDGHVGFSFVEWNPILYFLLLPHPLLYITFTLLSPLLYFH